MMKKKYFGLLKMMAILALLLPFVIGVNGCAGAGDQKAGSNEINDSNEKTDGKKKPDTSDKTDGKEKADSSDKTDGKEKADSNENIANNEEDGSLYEYKLVSSHPVDGRQGIACENGEYYVSGSTSLSVYNSDWEKINSAADPFDKFAEQVNHIGDIDVCNGEIYAGVEYFMDGEASNIQIAVYDAKTLELARTYMFDPESGQTECSGIAVDPDSNSVWMCSWAEDESGSYLYRYDLENGAYLGKVHMKDAPGWIQGIAYYDGSLYITADDGSADDDEPDHVYRCEVDLGSDEFATHMERELHDVTRQGEIEGLSFDKEKKQMLISYNRGAIIVKGMPKGFYEGYDEEIHEIFVYDMTPAS